MKKSINVTLAALLCTATLSFAQSTGGGQAAKSSGSTSSQQSQAGGQSSQKPARGQSNADDGKINASEQKGVKANEVGSSTRPGGEANENANYVGRNSDEGSDSKSMLNSKEAREKRRKNMTEADTTVRKGSGSSRRNTKDHTGITGNYRNEEIKHNQKTRPRPSTKND